MALQTVHALQPLLAPPLLPPLVLRTENGFFGAKRPAFGSFGDCEPCTRFEEPPPFPPGDPDPGDPDPGDRRPPVRYLKHQLHEAVDLEAEAGDCVFAAYTGRVVEVESSPDGTRGDVTIDHHPTGAGLVSRYLHLEGGSLCVELGDSVTKGEVIGRVGPGPADPHLHFELRIVVDRSDRRFWSDRNSIAIDPTRLLYRLEAGALPVVPSGAPSAVTSIGVETVANVPLFRASTEDSTEAALDPYGIPMYEPSTEHERGLATIFSRALELGRQVEVDYRDSVFFSPNRVPVSVRLV
jgi:Peptidase family M23